MNKRIVVYMAGNILKAATKSPFRINSNALCVPQPRHSTPKIFLLVQGSMYLSKSKMFFFFTILQKK